jgi:uncharacterized protein
VIEMRLVDVRVERATNNPVVVLQTTDGTLRILPIFIGMAEAAAIKFGLEKRETPRPMTHDLAVQLLGACNASLTQVVLTELRDNVFYANLHLRVGDRDVVVSGRPSDAIALAVRTASPIFALAELIEEHAVFEESEEHEARPAEELVDEFRKFIDGVDPEDFAS